MAAQRAPRVRRTQQNTQYTYNLKRRVHDVKTYPVLSSQGATILIYGHENGLTIVWRGGKRLKAPNKETSSARAAHDKRNGGSSADDSVMIIDLSDDEPTAPAPAKPFVDRPEFEELNPEGELSFPETVQTLDLTVGSAVRHIAVLPTPYCTAEDASWGVTEVLKDKMVFAFSCLTADVYVITLPLTPPSHESKARPELRSDLMSGVAGRGLWGETLISLRGQAQYSDGLAMTLAKNHNQPSAGRAKTSGDKSGSSTARIIVAAHSRQSTGVLRLWDVTVGQKRSPERPLEPFQADYLPSPLTSITFNPTHQTQLLAVASPHAVRVYDYSVPSVPADESEGSLPSQGSWLLSLYPPFIRTPGISTARKPVIAASWIAHGRAVLALMADGQWGIWDIDRAGSSASSGGLFGKATAAVKGAALTAFSASGHLEGTSPLRSPAAPNSSGDLVPMTPHTRREALSLSSLGGGPERLAAIRGGIDVVQLPGRGSPGTNGESAVLWLGGTDQIVAIIPFVAKFWEAQVRRKAGGGNLFSGSSQQDRMIRLADLNAGLLGERCCGASSIPHFSHEGSHDSNVHEDVGLPVEILVRGESRLVIVRESQDGLADTKLVSRLLGTRKCILGPAPKVATPTAIVAHPRPGTTAAPPKPTVLAQSIRVSSVRGRASLFGKRRVGGEAEQEEAARGQHRVPGFAAHLFGTDEPTLTQSMMGHGAGLVFAGQLEEAADATDDEDAADERNVEEEILDIMEIDRALEDMEEDRNAAQSHHKVFFENS